MIFGIFLLFPPFLGGCDGVIHVVGERHHIQGRNSRHYITPYMTQMFLKLTKEQKIKWFLEDHIQFWWDTKQMEERASQKDISADVFKYAKPLEIENVLIMMQALHCFFRFSIGGRELPCENFWVYVQMRHEVNPILFGMKICIDEAQYMSHGGTGKCNLERVISMAAESILQRFSKYLDSTSKFDLETLKKGPEYYRETFEKGPLAKKLFVDLRTQLFVFNLMDDLNGNVPIVVQMGARHVELFVEKMRDQDCSVVEYHVNRSLDHSLTWKQMAGNLILSMCGDPGVINRAEKQRVQRFFKENMNGYVLPKKSFFESETCWELDLEDVEKLVKFMEEMLNLPGRRTRIL